MDIKTLDTTVNSSTIQFEGNGLELAYELREVAVGELKLLLERELAVDKSAGENELYYNSEDVEEEDLLDDKEEQFFHDDDEIIDVDEEVIQDDDIASLANIDTELSTKIEQFKSFIAYADLIIKSNGDYTFSTDSPITEIITAFKRITIIADSYGEIDFTTGFKTV